MQKYTVIWQSVITDFLLSKTQKKWKLSISPFDEGDLRCISGAKELGLKIFNPQNAFNFQSQITSCRSRTRNIEGLIWEDITDVTVLFMSRYAVPWIFLLRNFNTSQSWEIGAEEIYLQKNRFKFNYSFFLFTTILHLCKKRSIGGICVTLPVSSCNLLREYFSFV